ncbi:DUF4382 domain-containing protein [Leptolyngbya sp. FACHB-16]|uniref:DUF4382 domain-containing protein n=1 Tax=unclassified Leptolyngbya TaxID=2650499 RepID=UPI0016897440|nr:DUF4382 domain-containing protein [Leptolyngbya sp. FACHB-16]MBD2156590.1 DUF4382 domain-containing protein [Leptolyngbya sp. FACHB-16]
MKKSWMLWMAIACSTTVTLQSCATSTPQAEAPAAGDATTETATASDETGTLVIRANGENFVRQGFVSKDGWEISFENLYVTLANITAYQTDPPFDAEAGTELKAVQEVTVAEPQTVDLAAGDETAEPIQVAKLDAPAGRYNALSWKMVNAPSGSAAGHTLMLVGTAAKDGQTVKFTMRLDEELAFVCGDFVGDERKGILEGGKNADLEATFHFDHLFGDADAPMEDDLNQGALGFEPFAAIAQNGTVDVTSADLQSQLTSEQYTQLLEILPSLGHVGEGHCEETTLS